jgi:hypothetical protein
LYGIEKSVCVARGVAHSAAHGGGILLMLASLSDVQIERWYCFRWMPEL